MPIFIYKFMNISAAIKIYVLGAFDKDKKQLFMQSLLHKKNGFQKIMFIPLQLPWIILSCSDCFLLFCSNPLKLDLLSLWHLSVLYTSLRIYTRDANIITQSFGRSSTALCCPLNTHISFDFSGSSEFILGLYRFSPSHYLPLQWAIILYYLNMVLGCWLTFGSVIVSICGYFVSVGIIGVVLTPWYL